MSDEKERPQTITIVSDTEKGRSFSASLLAYIRADSLWSGGRLGEGEPIRPVWMMLAASAQEGAPVMANLRLGKRAVIAETANRHRPTYFEFLRSAGYKWDPPQRHTELDPGDPDGRPRVTLVYQIYLADLFRIDPGMVDPAGVKMVVLPSAHCPNYGAAVGDVEAMVAHLKKVGYVGKEAGKEAGTEEQLRALAPLSVLFAVHLNRRTGVPIIPDERFYLQLLIRMLSAGAASLSPVDSYWGQRQQFGYHECIGYKEWGLRNVGAVCGVACNVNAEDLEKLLAEETQRYFAVVSGVGAADRRRAA